MRTSGREHGGRRLKAIIALAAVITLQVSPGRPEVPDKLDPASDAWRVSCRAWLEQTEAGASAGQCAGAVDALLYIGELLPADFRYCVPLRIPRREIILTILEDVEALRPEADRQDFKGMVLAILRYHWPCRE